MDTIFSKSTNNFYTNESEALYDAYLNGSEDALADLIELNKNYLLRDASVQLVIYHKKIDIEDVISEFSLALFEVISSKKFATWDYLLIREASFKAKDKIKALTNTTSMSIATLKRKIKAGETIATTVSYDKILESGIDVGSDLVTSAEDDLEINEFAEQLKENNRENILNASGQFIDFIESNIAKGKLAEDDYEMFKEKLSGKGSAEIAAEYGLSDAVVRKRLSRFTASVRNLLTQKKVNSYNEARYMFID